MCALGAELIQNGYTVHFTPAFALVQRLLAARGSYGLEKELQRLDAFDALIIDHIGYIQQDLDETEVLFTLLAERYERRTVMLTSNLVFSQWDRIFKDPMTTAAAIDRVIHPCVILELNGTSFRAEAAKGRMGQIAESTTACHPWTPQVPAPARARNSHGKRGCAPLPTGIPPPSASGWKTLRFPTGASAKSHQQQPFCNCRWLIRDGASASPRPAECTRVVVTGARS